MQEKHNSIAYALELRFSCTNPWTYLLKRLHLNMVPAECCPFYPVLGMVTCPRAHIPLLALHLWPYQGLLGHLGSWPRFPGSHIEEMVTMATSGSCCHIGRAAIPSLLLSDRPFVKPCPYRTSWGGPQGPILSTSHIFMIPWNLIRDLWKWGTL